MPSVLQDQMQKKFSCNTTNSSCCHDCLGMSSSQYNLLYAIYSWTNAFVVIGAGFFIDKLGNQIGALLFSSFCLIGSSIFAFGAFYRGTDYLLPLMLLGRLIFGAGNGSLTIVQYRITSFWFTGKELALAFGVTLAFSRLGSVLNFFLTGHLYTLVGLQHTLWIGAGLCGLGFISAIIVGLLDVYGFTQLGMVDKIKSESKNVKVSDFRQFSSLYWLLVLTIMFFHNGVFPFVADASKFIKDKYNYNNTNAAYITGTVYDVSLVLSPFLGGLVDVFGKRGILLIACAVATVPVFVFLAFFHIQPLVSTLWLGVTYSIAVASMWPTIPLIVAQATVGTAMGIATSFQMIGIGFSNLIVGEILRTGDNLPTDSILLHWKYVMIFLLCNILACVGTAIVLNILDTRKNGVLNMSRKQARQKAEDESNINLDVTDTKTLVDALESSITSNED